MLRVFKGPAVSRLGVRAYSMGAYEQQIYDLLKSKLNATELSVQDVSGGCGSMFAIQITSAEFKGKPLVKQHRLVNEILSEEIGKWHGLQLRTKAAQ